MIAAAGLRWLHVLQVSTPFEQRWNSLSPGIAGHFPSNDYSNTIDLMLADMIQDNENGRARLHDQAFLLQPHPGGILNLHGKCSESPRRYS